MYEKRTNVYAFFVLEINCGMKNLPFHKNCLPFTLNIFFNLFDDGVIT